MVCDISGALMRWKRFNLSRPKQRIRVSNVEIAKLGQRYPELHYLDLRGTVDEDEWMDELHADQRGWDKLAAKFHAKLQQVLPPDAELA